MEQLRELSEIASGMAREGLLAALHDANLPFCALWKELGEIEAKFIKRGKTLLERVVELESISIDEELGRASLSRGN
jgi:hypothetical protein